ncbi:hypothetical protein [Nonomuraea guangzhouensis]|uniref:NarG-like domain-containing protein n=1 Tax=Nonomuraea guangzhouensis TaxID=1291555 RepID=A0ABW4GZS0_9ACTN|nr:hypothetical protein [Nonomuraea guangzhouensis]
MPIGILDGVYRMVVGLSSHIRLAGWLPFTFLHFLPLTMSGWAERGMRSPHQGEVNHGFNR